MSALSPEDEIYLTRCIELAALGDAAVYPNPRVGALFVREGVVLGEGYHKKCGEAHAEVNAMIAAEGKGHALRGSTAYVSLEPCGHEGRTPSCAKMLIKKGVKRVVFAVSDPGPGTGGAQLLQEAGLEVCGPCPNVAAYNLLEPFLKNVLNKEAYFTLKWAMTLDGRIALESGDSMWVSGEESREKVHVMRTIMDGIMVGAGTVLADHPRLDVRYDLEGPSPRPIVWDPKGKTMDSPWWQKMEMRSPVVVTQVKSMGYPSFVEVLELDDPSALGRELFALGIHHVLVEGGAGLHGWMIDGGCADALQVFVAPKVCGGKGSLSPVGGEGVSKMNEALVGLDLELQKIGNDVWMSTVFKRYHPSF